MYILRNKVSVCCQNPVMSAVYLSSEANQNTRSLCMCVRDGEYFCVYLVCTFTRIPHVCICVSELVLVSFCVFFNVNLLGS